ncbi:hypothetical protein BDL97_17G003300 [Sphagnum fallax]|uniref:Uncharacterized protein n=1 Tax=Sphagnum jensenii TaxID=128206 RepID=A0ABP1AWY5_9BRYO|nr:hypothetical protein BDL97_17G003300 [Sphagnum fallax]
MSDPPARSCRDMRQVQMQAKGSRMSLAAAAASQHLQETVDPMISERKPQTAAAIPQHMHEPVDPMVRERKPQSRAAATSQHMQEAPVDLMIRERTMYFKGQSPLVAECPVVKKVATKAADAPHISGIKPIDLISKGAASWDKSKALPFESYAASSFIVLDLWYRKNPIMASQKYNIKQKLKAPMDQVIFVLLQSTTCSPSHLISLETFCCQQRLR